MVNIVNILSTEIDNLKRRVVKFLRKGKNDVQTAYELSPFGIDSNPVKNMTAIYAMTGSNKAVLVGYINKNQLAGTGEVRLYSTDPDGLEKSYVWFKSDGTILMNGDVDNLVRFSKLKEVTDELKEDISTLKNIFKTTWVPVANDGGAALKTASAVWANQPILKDINTAKINEIKTS